MAGIEKVVTANYIKELVEKEGKTHKEVSEVYADYPKEIQERRRKLWPRLKRAREDGRRAFFDKKEPDKLFIDGHLVT